MKKLFIMLFAAIMLCSCGNNYQVGNQKEQAIVKVYMKEHNYDFNDYYIRNDKTVGYHQGLFKIDSITHDTLLYIDLNSVVYEYGNNKEQFRNLIYLIDKGECMDATEYMIYTIDYGEEKYYKDYCKQIKYN